MTTLRDPFEVTHKKPGIGDGFDYVTWSQVADRLDVAAPGWSFTVVQNGPDWVLGRLNLGDGREFENFGYAEGQKKEPLKDATSDALKRCAALAGVARYLYEKDEGLVPATTQGRTPASPARPAPNPRPATPPPSPVGGLPEEPEWVMGTEAPPAPVERPVAVAGGGECPMHHLAWILQPGGVSKAGKAYDAFWKCPGKTDGAFCKEKPGAAWSARMEVAS